MGLNIMGFSKIKFKIEITLIKLITKYLQKNSNLIFICTFRKKVTLMILIFIIIKKLRWNLKANNYLTKLLNYLKKIKFLYFFS